MVRRQLAVNVKAIFLARVLSLLAAYSGPHLGGGAGQVQVRVELRGGGAAETGETGVSAVRLAAVLPLAGPPLGGGLAAAPAILQCKLL